MAKVEQAIDALGWLIGAYLAAGTVAWARAVRKVCRTPR